MDIPERHVVVIERGELKLVFEAATGSFAVYYYEHRFPVDPRESPRILQRAVRSLAPADLPEDAHAAKWAYRICKNAWIDELRSREVRSRHPEKAGEESQDVAPSAEHVAGGERQVTAVGEALARLPEEQRLALTMVAVDGKSYAEVAEILEIPVGTVMSRIARARRHLVAIYQGPGENN